MHQSWSSVVYGSSNEMYRTNDAGVAHDKPNASWKDIMFLLFSIGMVFGPHIGYVFQIHEMSSTRNVEGYSPLVSLILLVSNGIRILYYIGHHFALALLFQAMFAILVHTVLLIMVLHMTKNISSDSEEHYSGGGTLSMQETTAATVPAVEVNGEEIGTWEEIHVKRNPIRYILTKLDAGACLLEKRFFSLSPPSFIRRYVLWTLLTTIVVLLYYATIGTVWGAAPEVVGYIALGIEALLVLPQILRNHRRQSTEGLTIVLVLTWFLGDIIKVIYFLVDHQPFPFILCGIFQLSLDLVVIGQLMYFRMRRRSSAIRVMPATREDHTADLDPVEATPNVEKI
ncbi:hypothetical protein TCSYLVIO_003598 [Trypanosoma cruzi]|nr:hypothetical protein TCSYLVIO_003598 [Trypanosoma cruzi]KAF8280403.1 putative PQ loop repeat [Trypanosoma cruzi]PBJ74787.1 hypothetical protein BCY84_12133 [Trypanosoma cruzi cruzi]